MGDDLCSRRLSSNPGHWMVMNIFSQWFVVKLLFEKTKNKWKEAWTGPFSFFKKIISKLGPTDFRIVSCSTRIWEKLKILQSHPCCCFSYCCCMKRHTSPVWPDLAKFRHFGNFWRAYVVLGKILNLLLENNVFYWANFQCCKHNIGIWSHCSGTTD